MTDRRDIELASAPNGPTSSVGRNVIAAIGIDRYRHWPRLSNAVRDASGATALFQRLGFEQIAALVDDDATGNAIQTLVADDLMALGVEDSLVLFYAGHGATRKHRLGDRQIKTGYLIPVDASGSPDKVASWIDMEGWLRAVSLLPAKHILVVLDACHSGIALDPIIKWRDVGSWKDTPLSTLKARRSRRIITSALDDQVALDSGPVPGHSLFTGCLIEGLTNGIRRAGSRVTTGSELGLYVQRRVETYPNSRQTPDYGTFAFDERGEMEIPLDANPEPSTPMPLPATGPAPSLVPTPTTETAAASAPMPGPAVEPASRGRVRDRKWRWLFIGAAGAALIGYRMSGGEQSPIDSRVDAPANVAAGGLLDASAVLERSQPAEPSPGRCLDGMVPVPAGKIRMGSPDGVGDTDEHPLHEVTLSTYCIDKTEVTVKAYAACVAAKGCSAALLTVSWSGYSADDVKLWSQFCNGNDRPSHPINCVDWNQAAAYCRWAGKRLPTEAEWEYAARGNDGRVYPWGKEPPSAKRLNACGSECVKMGKRALKQDWVATYNASDGWETTAPVGSFPDGASPFGALDMAGNVWEWTSDWYGKYTAAETTNPRGAETGSFRVIRGGGWINIILAGRVRAATRDWFEPSFRSRSVGIRCARGD